MLSWSPTDLLPGFYVLALGVVLAVLLKILGDPLPLRAWSIFGAVLLILLAPALFEGEILLPLDSLRGSPPFGMLPPTNPHGNLLQGDLIQLVLPLSLEARSEILGGSWPLWNPMAGAGMPLLADPQAQPFQPLVVLAYPFDLLRGAAVSAALRVLCALAFCCALLRRLGLGEGPAVAGAVAYGCGGFLLLWLGWPLANSAALLPVVLYAVAACLVCPRGTAPKGRRREVFLAVAMASLLLAGHPETIFYAGLFAAAFTVLLLRRQESVDDPLGRRLSRLAVPALVAVAVTAPILLPTARYLPHTWRVATLGESGEGTKHASTSPESVENAPRDSRFARLLQAWVPLAAPNAFGNSRYAHYWGQNNSNEDSSGFVGTITLLAAFLGALLAAGRRRLIPGEGLALAVVVLVLGVLASSAVGSGFFLRGLHGGGRLRMLFAFSMAFLAACALEHFQRERRPVRWISGWLLGAGAVLVGFHFFVYVGLAPPEGGEPLKALRLGWLHWHVRLVVVGGFLLAFARRRRWMPWAAALLIGGELLLAFQDANPPMPRRLAFPTPPPLATALSLSDEPRLVGLDGALPPNLAAVYGAADARVYNPVEPAPYAALVEPLLEQPRKNVPRAALADHPLYDLLGIGFVLAGPGVDLPLELIVDDASGRLFRRSRPLDVLFLPEAARAVPEASWPDAVHRAEDFAASSLVLAERGENLPWKARLPEGSLLRGIRQDGPRVHAVATFSEQRLLASRLLAVGPDSGWRLVSNGREQKIMRANGPLVAAWLPAGQHELDLFYRPPGFFLGCALAALGLSLSFLRWWTVPSAREAVESNNE